MTITARTAATAAAWVAAGALGATVLTGVASAGSLGSLGPMLGGTGPMAAAMSSTGADTTARRGMMRDVLHGSLTVKTETGTKVVDVQRGKITAASATSVTVTSTDGFSATYAITDATTVRRDRDSVRGSDLVVGDTVMVRASSGTADVVRALSPDAVTRLKDRIGNGRAGMGGMGSGLGGGMGAGMGMGDADDA